jgi:tetratricopeptide (TPR) repeat protein
MPRVNPNRSPYCSARHLLRNLNDGRALLRNPFVRAHCNGASQTDALRFAQNLFCRAFAAIDNERGNNVESGKRQTAILLRYDMLGHSRKAIAGDFHISLRQFERERSMAMERFTCHLQMLAQPPARISVESDIAGLTRTHALRVADSGDHLTAIALLESIASNANSIVARVRALLDAAFVDSSELDAASAYRHIRDAAALLDAASAPEAQLLLGELRAVELQMAFLTEGPNAIGGALDSSVLHADHRIYLTKATADIVSGNVRGADENIRLAADALSRTRNFSSASLVSLKILEPQIQFWMDGDESALLEGCKVAAQLAQRDGLQGHFMVAQHLVDISKWALGRDALARDRVRSLADRIGRAKMLPKVLQVDIYFGLADAELSIGDPWRALHWANLASDLSTSNFHRALFKGIICRAFAKGGRLERAYRIAEEIVTESPRATSPRADLCARLTLSEVSYARGHFGAAYENLRDAARLAEHCGSAMQVSRISRTLNGLAKRRSSVAMA